MRIIQRFQFLFLSVCVCVRCSFALWPSATPLFASSLFSHLRPLSSILTYRSLSVCLWALLRASVLAPTRIEHIRNPNAHTHVHTYTDMYTHWHSHSHTLARTRRKLVEIIEFPIQNASDTQHQLEQLLLLLLLFLFSLWKLEPELRLGLRLSSVVCRWSWLWLGVWGVCVGCRLLL